MDYEKKYENSLDAAKKIYANMKECGNFSGMEDLEVIFPELKESEGEKIRKEIEKDAEVWYKEHYEGSNPQGRSIVIGAYIDGAIAWLEKQGENPITIPKWKYKKDNAPLLRDSLILNKYGCVAKSPSGAIVSDVWVIDYDELAKLPKEELEKQGEHKVEPDITDITEEYQKGWDAAMQQLPQEVDNQVWQIANNAAITWEHSFAVLTAAKNAYDKGKADGITLVKEIFTEDILYRFVRNSVAYDGEIDDKSELREYFLDLLNEEIEQKTINKK